MDTFDIDSCAEFLNVNRTTILELAGNGELPGARIGRAWVFLKEDVIDFLRAKIREQSAERRASARKTEKPEPPLAVVLQPPRSRRKATPALPEFIGQV